MNNVSDEAGNGKGWMTVIRSSPTPFLALLYLLWLLASMFQDYFRFRAFDVNIFHFATIEDFALAPFRDPVSFASVLLAAALVLLYLPIVRLLIWLGNRASEKRKWSQWMQKEVFPGSPYPWARSLTLFGLILLMFFGRLFANDWYSDEWKNRYLQDPNNHVNVWFNEYDDAYAVGSKGNFVLLGASTKYYFLRAKKGCRQGKSIIVPTENVLLISK